jgi:pimeloyl-ACP methyl ester carboxylesterase
VCLYSTGLSPKEGRELMRPLMDAAKGKGFKDQIVLDHCNEAPYEGKCKTHDEYIRALVENVYAAGADWRTRPWLIVGHSNGCVGAFGLARMLGPKVRALCILCRRPPSIPLLPDVLGLETCEEVLALPAHGLAQKIAVVYSNPTLLHYTKDPDEEKWNAGPRAAVHMARAQYSSPCMLCAAKEIAEVIGDPASAAISAPIVGIASAEETAQGETAEKMEEWRALSKGSFRLVRDVPAAHMDVPKHSQTIQVVLEALQPHLPSQ